MARALEQAIKLNLIRGDGDQRFALREDARPALDRALAQDLASAQPLDALLAALRLAAAMDGALRSPGVAAIIRDVMKQDVRAVRVLRARRVRPSGVDAVRRFTRQQGGGAVVRAPVLAQRDQRTPAGAVPLRALLDPGRDAKARVIAGHRKDKHHG